MVKNQRGFATNSVPYLVGEIIKENDAIMNLAMLI
jgi:hypothetical protein